MTINRGKEATHDEALIRLRELVELAEDGENISIILFSYKPKTFGIVQFQPENTLNVDKILETFAYYLAKQTDVPPKKLAARLLEWLERYS